METVKSGLLEWKLMLHSAKELIPQIETDLSTCNQSIVQYCIKKEGELQLASQKLVKHAAQEFQVERSAMEQEKAKLVHSLKEKEVAITDYTNKYTG